MPSFSIKSLAVALSLGLVSPLTQPFAQQNDALEGPEQTAPIEQTAQVQSSAKLTLDNGDVLSGTVEALEEDSVIFRTEFGALTIPVERVLALESEGEPLQRRWRQMRSTRMPSALPQPVPEELPAEVIATVRELEPDAGGRIDLLHPKLLVLRREAMDADAGVVERVRSVVDWSGSFELETAAIEGANRRREYYGRTDNTWTFYDRDRLNFDARFERETVEDVRVVDRYLLRGSYDRFLSDRAYLSPSAERRYNSLTTVRRTDLYALRLGYVALSDDIQRLEVSAGPAYQQERLSDGSRQSTGVASWEVDYDLSLRTLIEGLSFFHEQSGTFDVGDQPGRTQVVADSGLRYTFFGGIFLAGVLELDYDSRAPADDATLERTYRLNVGYSW